MEIESAELIELGLIVVELIESEFAESESCKYATISTQTAHKSWMPSQSDQS